MGDKGSVLVKEKNVDKHRNFEVLNYYGLQRNYSSRCNRDPQENRV
jgi:hypothetical protein